MCGSRAADLDMPSEVLKPKTLAAPAELPPIVLAPPLMATPTGLPKLAPLDIRADEIPEHKVANCSVPAISTPSELLKPMTFAAAPVLPPTVLFGLWMMIPIPLPRPAPLEFVPIKLPRTRLCGATPESTPFGAIERPAVVLETRMLPAFEAALPTVLLAESMTIPEPSKLAISSPSIVLRGADGPTVSPSAGPLINCRRSGRGLADPGNLTRLCRQSAPVW